MRGARSDARSARALKSQNWR